MGREWAEPGSSYHPSTLVFSFHSDSTVLTARFTHKTLRFCCLRWSLSSNVASLAILFATSVHDIKHDTYKVSLVWKQPFSASKPQASFPPIMLTISGTSYQLTLYILILKPNSQIYIYTFSGLAASCSPPLMGHYGNHNISLMELTEVKQILFFSLLFCLFWTNSRSQQSRWSSFVHCYVL